MMHRDRILGSVRSNLAPGLPHIKTYVPWLLYKTLPPIRPPVCPNCGRQAVLLQPTGLDTVLCDYCEHYCVYLKESI